MRCVSLLGVKTQFSRFGGSRETDVYCIVTAREQGVDGPECTKCEAVAEFLLIDHGEDLVTGTLEDLAEREGEADLA
jgi:hypothetical protein